MTDADEFPFGVIIVKLTAFLGDVNYLAA